MNRPKQVEYRMARCLFIIGIILTLFVIFSAGCTRPSIVYPALHPGDGPPRISEYTHSFPFQDYFITVRVPVEENVYLGARNTDKKVHIYGDVDQNEWLPGYYLVFISDSEQISFFDSLGDELSEIRRRYNLDNDEYVELISVFVQSIPYKTDKNIENPKFPVETFVEGNGDCDDKSLLLAGILAHEGFDVVLFYFDSESHMALGVRAPDCGFQESGYAYIETSNISLIGIPPRELQGGVVLHTRPVIISVPSGTLQYGACTEILEIEGAVDSANSAINNLKPDLDLLDGELAAMQTDLEEMKTMIDTLRRTGTIEEYNEQVSEYNQITASYNQKLKAFNRLRDDYSRFAELHNYYISHQHDRKGTYAFVKAWEMNS